MNHKSVSANELAAMVGGIVKGDGERVVSGVAAINDATPEQVSFLGNKKYQHWLRESKAGVVLVCKDLADEPTNGKTFIVCDNVDLVFSKAIMIFAPPEIEYPRTVHPSAVVAQSAKIGQLVHIGAHVVVEEGAEIGDGAVIAAGCYIGHEVKIGAGTKLYPHVSIMARCTIGRICIIHSGVVIGADGFGFLPTPTGIVKVPQTGIVEIQDDVEIGANSTIDRARFGKTVIKSNVKIDDQVMIGHNCQIAESCILVAQCGIAGSSRLGQGVIVAAKAGISGHLDIGAGSQIGGMSGVHKSLPVKSVVIGTPAENQRDFMTRITLPGRVEKLKNQLAELQKQLDELKSR